MTDPRTSEYNQRGDVWQHTYAYPPAVRDMPQRSPDADDEADTLYYYAQVNEAADRKLAQALRAGAARIRALEAIVFRSKVPTEGNTE